jgi:hypothetical protein
MESSGHAFGVPEDNAAQSGTGGAVYQAAPVTLRFIRATALRFVNPTQAPERITAEQK